jgi:hypothetical protein
MLGLLSSNEESFIQRWEKSSASERANYALFLSEFCDYLDLPRPEPSQADESRNTYVIDKAVEYKELDGSTTTNFIDLYRRNCFVLEAKQGSNPVQQEELFELVAPEPKRKMKRGTAVRGTRGWDSAMLAARGQAERYAKALPASEGWPPFLIVVDVGHSIELFADFSLTGKAYLPFPGPRNFRILMQELEQPEIRERLRSVWLDPHSLDPARERAKVTREVAGKLATLARNLENQYTPKEVAEFLTRCIFTSFAEDVGLLPDRAWLDLLESLREDENNFPPVIESLWKTMNEGGYSPLLRKDVLQFNGGLFESTRALPLNRDQIYLLIEAANSRWRDVEPAIFGTLLERALDPAERHALGAHYTPRAYVERLVLPTLVEPLRDDWRNTQAVITELLAADKHDQAIEAANQFHRQLCNTRVLDPACGSGNFLYVALEHMKRLEGEVLETLHALGQSQEILEHTGLTVDPHQLLGIEVNPRAAVIADLVLWIGYLQWHFRTRGDVQPPIPVIRNFHNVREADALIEWDSIEPQLDENGHPLTEWDGISLKTNPITGRKVKDGTKTKPIWRYRNPRVAPWPNADFIVGNPPFLGKLYLIRDLGTGYVSALRDTYAGRVPDGVDFGLYWWQRCAESITERSTRRAGLINTKSITQTMNRRVVKNFLSSNPKANINFAIPNHAWVDNADGAAVRIAMTAFGEEGTEGFLSRVIDERSTEEGVADVTLATETGRIHEDLRIGVDITKAQPLKANEGIAGTGFILGNRGFVLTREEVHSILGENGVRNPLIFPLLNGRDLTESSRNLYTVDTYGWTEHELMAQQPEIYQRLRDTVFQERQANNDPRLRREWWLLRRSNEQIRSSIKGLHRFIVTSETARNRLFVFVDAKVRPEHKLIIFGSSDAYTLAILSSRIHTTWAKAAGGRLGVGNDPVYSKTLCFDPFPFPVPTTERQEQIRESAERLTAHRNRQKELHPWLTLTEMYNVLDKLRAGTEFSEQERLVHQAGLISVLREIHDELDAAVFAAYGWSSALSDEDILSSVVSLNAQRRAEEHTGVVRWLRPDFQASQQLAVQTALAGMTSVEAPAPVYRKQPWPATLPAQVRAVKASLRAKPMQNVQQVAAGFKPASRTRVAEILETLTVLGQTRQVDDRYSL